MGSSNNPLSIKNIVAGLFVTVVGGILLAYILQEGRFAPTPAPVVTPSQAVASSSSQPNVYDIAREENYLEQSLDEHVPSNGLVCLTTGPIVVQNTTELVQFFGNGRAAVICWLGPQRAQAYNLTGSSLKYVTIYSGDMEEIAVSLVLHWGEEMTTRSDGCGADYGPCDAADLAIVRPDGSIIWP